MSAESVVGVLDVLPEPTFLASLEGQILAANRALSAQLGVPRDQLQGFRLHDLVLDPAERVSTWLRECVRNGQMLPGALTLKRAGGQTLTCRAGGVAYRNASQALPAVLVRLAPMTDQVSAFVTLNEKIHALNAEVLRRRQAESELNRERETLEVTLRSIGDAVIVADADGRVVFMNGVAEELTGRPYAQVARQKLPEVFPIVNEDTGAAVENPVEKVLASGHIVGLANHTLLRRADGTYLPIDDSASPIRTRDGLLIGVVLIFRDITARRRYERDQREADRRKDEFLAILAHELRNPLAPIRNAMQIMQLADGNAAIAAAARTIIERQVRHLSRLIDDLLDISRITQGKIELRREPVSFDAVLQMALEIARPELEGKQHPLQIELPSEPLDLLADPHRLAQAFANLLSNASKYSPTASPIRITASVQQSWVTIEISDQGVGVPADMLERVFDLFVQVKAPGNDTTDGLGIGLSLVRRIIELHGGQATLASGGHGRGTTVRARLPRSAAVASRLPAPAATTSAPQVRKLRILIADDNRDAASTLSMMLQLEGHQVQTAHDGAEALAAGARFAPDLVLLDIGMPVLDGYETARQMRQSAWGECVHIAALTGWGQESDRRKAMEAGFDDHLVKPVALENLERLIDSVANKAP